MYCDRAKKKNAGTKSHALAFFHIKDNALVSIFLYTNHNATPVTASFKNSLTIFQVLFLSICDTPDLVCFFIARFKINADADFGEEADGDQLYAP